jgi:AcrR family transcriptional regulator
LSFFFTKDYSCDTISCILELHGGFILSDEKLTGNSLKEKLLDVSMQLFNENGFVETSVQSISDAANVSKGSFYYYYKDKEFLLYEICRESFKGLLSTVRKISASEVISPPEQIRQIIRSCIYSVYEDSASSIAYFTFVQEGRHLNPEHKIEAKKWRREYLDCIRKVIKRGVLQGDFKNDLDQGILAYAIIGMSMWTAHWYTPGGRLNLDEIADIYCGILFSGISAKSAD